MPRRNSMRMATSEAGSYLTYALCETVYRDSVGDSSVAGAASEPPVMTNDGFIGAVASFPVGRIPNSDRMALKAAAKPVACSLMAGSTLSTTSHGTEGICREFSDTSGGQEAEGAYKMSGAITVWG